MLNVESKPFFLNYAIERTQSSTPELKGHYCDIQNMWVDDKSNTPIIDIVNKNKNDNSNYLEMFTKTKVQAESDDMNTKLFNLAELFTKTDVVRESDDTTYNWDLL